MRNGSIDYKAHSKSIYSTDETNRKQKFLKQELLVSHLLFYFVEMNTCTSG